MKIDRQELAEAVAEAMFFADRASRDLGMQIVSVRPGYAQLKMTVRPDMMNSHYMCHGGFIFCLADSAFAFGCNTHNHTMVAASCTIDYLAPAHQGDELTAEAVEQAVLGRTGIYDVAVSNQNGERIAIFRGRSHRVKGDNVPGAVGA